MHKIGKDQKNYWWPCLKIFIPEAVRKEEFRRGKRSSVLAEWEQEIGQGNVGRETHCDATAVDTLLGKVNFKKEYI